MASATERMREWRAANPERNAANHKRWVDANRERLNKKSRERYASNPENSRAAQAKYRASNLEKVLACQRASARKRRAQHSVVESRRRAKLRNACVSWADEFVIEEMFDLAARRTKATGFSWQVDHIVPLKSKFVCGLHVEGNLRVIPAVENFRKGNRWWPDMTEYAKQ